MTVGQQGETPYYRAIVEDFRNFGRRTKKAYRRGQRSAALDFLWNDVIDGKATEAEAMRATKRYENMIRRDPIEAANWASDIWYKTAGIAPAMVEGTLEGFSYGTAAAGTAALAGQAGPQALAPEEIVTVPGAFAAGTAAGSLYYWSRQGRGAIYREARMRGVDKKTAGVVASIGGPIYGAVEHAQVRRIPGLAKIKGKITKIILGLVKNVGIETAEEGAQSLITDASVTVGQLIDDKMEAAELPAATKQAVKRALNEMKEAAGPMALLQLPGAGIGAGIGVERAGPETDVAPEPIPPITDIFKTPEQMRRDYAPRPPAKDLQAQLRARAALERPPAAKPAPTPPKPPKKEIVAPKPAGGEVEAWQITKAEAVKVPGALESIPRPGIEEGGALYVAHKSTRTPGAYDVSKVLHDSVLKKDVAFSHVEFETAEGAKAYLENIHKINVKEALEQGKSVPREVLEEYKGEKWADEALDSLTQPPTEKGGRGKVEVTQQDQVDAQIKIHEDAKIYRDKKGNILVAGYISDTSGLSRVMITPDADIQPMGSGPVDTKRWTEVTPTPPKAEGKKVVEGKEPWEMTREEAVQITRMPIRPEYAQTEEWVKLTRALVIGKNEYRQQHRRLVEAAVKENKPVPLEVLKEYKGEKWADEALKPKRGSDNTGVTRAEYEKIKAKQKKGKLKGGREAGGTILFSPEEWSDLLKIGAFHLEAGARSFADWSGRMIEDFGEAIRPHLDKLWADLRPTAPPTTEKSATAHAPPVEQTPIERGFVKQIRRQFPELDTIIAGQYIPRSTDELAMKAANLVKDNIDKAEEIVRTRTDDVAVATSSELIKYYNKKAQQNKGEKQLWYQKAADVVHEISPKLTEAGRTVQSAYIASLQTPEGMLRFAAREIEKYNEQTKITRGGLLGLRKPIPKLTPQQTEDILTRANKIQQMPDGIAKARATQKLQNKIKELVPTPFMEKLAAVRNAGLLTGIKTSGLNTMSNLFHGVSEIAADVPASFYDSVASLFTGKRTTALTVKGYTKGMKKGFWRGWDYLKTGFDERNIGAKLDYKKISWGKNPVWRGLGAYTDFVYRMMGAEDQPFYYGALSRSIASQAIAQAKNKGLKGKKAKAFVENLMTNPTNDMIEAATADAQVAVYQNKTTLGRAGTALRKLPGGKWILPFVRTPSAVAMQILNYSPVGAVKTLIQNIGKGRFNQREFSRAMGRATIGIIPMVIGYALAKAAMISLEYPKSERERELWKAEGRQVNSIKIDGKWRRLNVLGPAGGMILVGAHYYKSLQNTGSPSKAMALTAQGMLKSIKDEAFLTGLSRVLDIGSDRDPYGKKAFDSLAGSLVPTLISDIARTTDSVERRTATARQRVQSRIPGLRQKLPPRITVFGQDLPRYGGNILEVMADPTRPAKINQDVVVDEMRRLWDEDVKVAPTLLGDRDGYKVLTPDQNTRLWRRAGEMIYGKMFEIITAPGYRNLSNEERAKILDYVVGTYKDVARAETAWELLLEAADKDARFKELREGGLITQNVMRAMAKYF
jgi:hypothetical protein